VGAGHAGAAHAPASGLHQPAGDSSATTPAAAGTSGQADPPTRAVATSPAVGFFRPRADLAAGARVRGGDRIGAIDVLGIPHEIVAPTDGILGATLVEPGDPVEYGQDIVEIELLSSPGPGRPEAG
jgi:biotin carboxyl carrier protein